MTNERPRPAATEPKRPYHVGVAVGLTTGVYAASLLATASMQIDHDRALIADREPVQAAIDALDRHHDRLEIELIAARLRYQDGTTGYEALTERLTALERRLAETDAAVGAVERLGASLPKDLALPNVPRTRVGTGSAKGGRGTTVTLPPAPQPAAPPPTDGTTGASGAP